jgi:choice-of-anchor B domain-containing protein
MLKLYWRLFALVILLANTTNAQLNLNLLGTHQYAPSRGNCSDVWGYADGTGNEYAIIGNESGTSIVDVTDPTSPVEVFYSPGAQTIWRDIKTWGSTAYITNEGGGGLKIIDMSSLPAPITGADVYQYTGTNYPFTTAHNIFIDEVGRAFLSGSSNGFQGTIILDVATNPLSPTELGTYNDFYLHDLFVRGDTLWGGAVYNGLFVVADVSDELNTTTMATQATPSSFTHNVWLSDDGNTLFTTDELANAYIASYDVSNLGSIIELDLVQSSPGQNVIPHNTFVYGNYLVTSYYTDGIVVHDATNPANLIEVGNYDTSPAFSGSGFNGAWGVYPYLPSGNILASDIENGLFILGQSFAPTASLEGNITDAVTTSPLDNVQIEFVSTQIVDFSDAAGNYISGIVVGGSYDITFSKIGYAPQTISNVVLTIGNTTTLDVQLVPLITFTLQGLVVDVNLNPISNAQVIVSNPSLTTTVTTNGVGEFDILTFPEGTYDVSIGLWGYHTLCLSNEQLTIAGGPYVYVMEEGYSDIFELDLGWSISGNPDSGDWERDEPNGTTFQGDESNPEDDSDDCGSLAYITGNDGGQAESDDIDNGTTVLTSPIFDLSAYTDPYLSFERWFINEGGSGTPNDSLVVDITNGTQTVRLDFADFNSPNLSSWAYREFRVTDFLPATTIMQMKIRAMDVQGEHISEGGFDNFFIWDSIPDNIGIIELSNDDLVNVYPVPFTNEINIVLDQVFENVHVEVLELNSGKLVESRDFINVDNIKMKNDYAKGMYLIRVFGGDSILTTRRVVKM